MFINENNQNAYKKEKKTFVQIDCLTNFVLCVENYKFFLVLKFQIVNIKTDRNINKNWRQKKSSKTLRIIRHLNAQKYAVVRKPIDFRPAWNLKRNQVVYSKNTSLRLYRIDVYVLTFRSWVRVPADDTPTVGVETTRSDGHANGHDRKII